MVDDNELVATERGAMIVWLLVEAKGQPVPVAVLAEKTGLKYDYLLEKVLLKLERRFPIIRLRKRPYCVSIKLPE